MSRKLFLASLLAAAAMVGYQFMKTTSAEAASTRVFEKRTYTCFEGKLDALNARFRDHTIKIFKKHGMTSVGYWTPQDSPASENTLIYILAHDSRDIAKKHWAEFAQDPEWTAVAKASEADGKIVEKVDSTFMVPSDYSPLK